MMVRLLLLLLRLRFVCSFVALLVLVLVQLPLVCRHHLARLAPRPLLYKTRGVTLWVVSVHR